MWAWTGKSGVGGLPHMSWVKRKPEPLGLELKTICDGETGVMLFIEMQEGAIRMARRPHTDTHSATTACTMRLIDGVGPTDGKKRTVYGDSWFMSVATRDALKERYNYHAVGSIKTAHSNFPAEAIRWTLASTERGAKVVFKAEGEELWAIGWNDVHYKLYLATCGHSGPGIPAQKTRQRADGRNTTIDVPRPAVVAEYAMNMGNVDLHNRYRQGEMALHKIWKTHTWQHRMLNELHATTVVDAYLLSKKYLPKWKENNSDDHHASSHFFRWLGALMTRMIELIGQNDNIARAEQLGGRDRECKQILIGKKRQQTGTGAGNMKTIQMRCLYCSRRKNYAPFDPDTRAKRGAYRTAWTCSVHGGVYMCRRGKHTCWAEHLQEVEDERR